MVKRTNAADDPRGVAPSREVTSIGEVEPGNCPSGKNSSGDKAGKNI